MASKMCRKKITKKPTKKKTAVKQIYKTTDGYLSNKPAIKKPRNVAAIEQRKKDGAVAVVKISSKEGKEKRSVKPLFRK